MPDGRERIAGCVEAAACPPAWEFAATGTRWRLYHAGWVDAGAAATVAAAIERDEVRWSRFRPDSEVSRLNAAAGTWVEVSAPTFELLEASIHWTRRTAGVFQPLVGRALAKWGYAWSIVDAPPFARAAPRPAPVSGELGLDPQRRRACVPQGEALDLGGIGKGWIAARAGALLASIADDPLMLIDAGGDLLAITGAHVVTVGDGIGEQVHLPAGHAIATSGVSRRRWVNGDGSPAHHLIDPRTGAPGPDAHATVLAHDAVSADVYAKVLALAPTTVDSCAYPALVRSAGRTTANSAWAAVTAGAL